MCGIVHEEVEEKDGEAQVNEVEVVLADQMMLQNICRLVKVQDDKETVKGDMDVEKDDTGLENGDREQVNRDKEQVNGDRIEV